MGAGKELQVGANWQEKTHRVIQFFGESSVDVGLLFSGHLRLDIL